jgi:hypothetical protein
MSSCGGVLRQALEPAEPRVVNFQDPLTLGDLRARTARLAGGESADQGP